MSKKKKIVFLHVAMVLGGAETVLVNYLNILAKNPNYDVHLIIFEGMEKFNLEKIDSSVKLTFLLNDIETQFNRCAWAFSNKEYLPDGDKKYFSSWKMYSDNVRLQRLIEHLDRENYDVVIDFLATSIAFITKDYLEKIKAPLVYWIHSNADFDKWENNLNYKINLEYIDAFVSICDDMNQKCQYILSEKLFLNKKYHMLYNPVDRSRVLKLAAEDVGDFDMELLDQPFIIQVARLFEHQKNHLKMLEIFAKLKQKGIKEKLYIIGDGESKQLLQDKIKELNLENECLLLGARTNPMPFMKKAKLLIHTANYEGLPTVFIESMMCGTPVIAFDCPTGPREILEDGKYGGLIPMGNDELFIETAYELLTNENKREYYISLLPEAVSRFSMETIETQFCELIEEVIKNGKVN